MRRVANLIGRNVARMRYQRAWTQDQLVAKLQVRGCDLTRDILASIETQRCVATDKHTFYLAQVFGVEVGALFQ